MNYEELIAMALKGRSVNSMAKAWGIPQPTLDSYVKGKALPDFDTALKITREAGAPEKEAWEALAEKTRTHRASKFRLQKGFVVPGLLSCMAIVALAVNLFLTNAEAKTATSPMKRATAEVLQSLYYVKRRTVFSVLRAVWTTLKRWILSRALEPTTT